MLIICVLAGIVLAEFVYIIFLYNNRMQLKQLSGQLAVEEKRYRVASEITNDILFEYDIEKDTMQFAKKYGENFGGEIFREQYSLHAAEADYILDEDRSIFRGFLEAMKKGQKNIEVEFRMKDLSGAFVWCQFKGKTIYESLGRPVRVIGKIINIDIQKRELERLQIKSQLDPLTGAYNKAATKEKINELLKKSRRDEIHALMIIDIDNFKRINDTYGHIFGDTVLVNVVARIHKMFRDEDIAGRIGGDEFVVFMNHVNSREDIANKAIKLFGAFKNRYNESDEGVEVTGSIGISVYPLDGNNYDDLLEKADKALYQVKASGKNNFNIYCEEG